MSNEIRILFFDPVNSFFEVCFNQCSQVSSGSVYGFIVAVSRFEIEMLDELAVRNGEFDRRIVQVFRMDVSLN